MAVEQAEWLIASRTAKVALALMKQVGGRRCTASDVGVCGMAVAIDGKNGRKQR